MFSVEQLVRKFLTSSVRLYVNRDTFDNVSTHYMELAKSVINYSMKCHHTDFAPFWISLYDDCKHSNNPDEKIKQAIFHFGESMFGKEGRVDNCHFKFSALLHFATIGASVFLIAKETEKVRLIEISLAAYIENEISQWWYFCGRLEGISSHCKTNGPSLEQTEAIEKIRDREAQNLNNGKGKPVSSTVIESGENEPKRAKIEMEDLLSHINSYAGQPEEYSDSHSVENEISSTVSADSCVLNPENQAESDVPGLIFIGSAGLFAKSESLVEKVEDRSFEGVYRNPDEDGSRSNAPIDMVTLSSDSETEFSQ